MNTSDWIGVGNVAAQVIVAVVAIWAVVESLRANKRQIQASEKQLQDQIQANDSQVRLQIQASEKQMKEQIAASDLQVRLQIEESRRLATEERQHQSRPIIVPEEEVAHRTMTSFSPQTGQWSESLYTPEDRVNWNWSHPIVIKFHNMGNGLAFNIHAILYGSQDFCNNQFVSWDNGPLEEKNSSVIELIHSSELQLSHEASLDGGKHPLYDRSLDSPSNPYASRIACLTITYHDLFGKKYVSIFHYTLQHKWIHLATEEIPFDLKDLNNQKKQGPKLSAPPIKTS